MSALIFIAQPSEIALSAATAKTVLQITAPSNHRLRILEWGVFFDGVSTTAEPAVVQLLRQSGSFTATSLTLVKEDDSIAETIQSTAIHTATVEGTDGDVLRRKNVHPQGGYEWQRDPTRDLIIGGGDKCGIKITAPAAVNVIPYMVCEE